MSVTNLIVWRHTEAEVTASSGLDADRALTSKGLADANQIAKWLKKHLPKETHIYCSPTLRCRQTLDALLGVRNKNKAYPVEYTEALALESRVSAIYQQLRKVTFSTALLVGHQPLHGELVASLLANGTSEESIEIKKGAVWWLRHCEHREITAMQALQQPFEMAGNMEILTVLHPKFFK